MSRLDETRLENVHQRDGKIIARCPACFEQGHDKTGNHLVINETGKFGCVQFPGDQGIEHRKRIFALVGVRDETEPRTFPTLGDAIASVMRKLKMLVKRKDVYYDADGNVHFVVVRFDGKKDKDFRPFHQSADG